MMYSKKLIICVSLAALTMSGCVSMSAVPSGQSFKAETAYSVTPTTSWTRMPNGLNPTKGSALTQDGVPLGAVYLVTAKNDKPMIDNVGSSKNLPRYTLGSTALEQIDFVTSSMSLIGYLDLTTTNVRPADIDGQPGTEFSLTGKYPSGLNMKGDAAIVESNDGLNIVLYVAPEMHYYDKYYTEASAIIKSVDLK